MLYEKSNLNKPFTRMWMYGCNASKEEIDENLKHIQDANIGGIELQMLYPLEDSKNNNFFFSPKFFEMLNYFINSAYEKNINIDLTLGSGWPFGAPFITKDMSPDILLTYQQDIKGPTNYSFDFTNIISGKIVKAILCQIKDAKVVESTLQDVTKYVNKTYISVWPWGEEICNVPVLEGEWRLFIFVSNEYRQHVGKAAPNMEGYVMDHCREDVTKSYIDNFANVYLNNINKEKVRSVFCDSIELTASNWTKYILEEFEKDHGYDLSKYLPALWMDIGEKTPFIRHDYYETYGRLTINNFFKMFKDWASDKGVQFRLQAHGTWADIIDAYGSSHIAEGETFGNGDSYTVNINHRRLAASSGLIYDMDLVSNESYTWLRKPRFLVTLDMLKRASDAIFIDGINHIINHGYSFYKGEHFENIFYASSVISPHNTWFKHLKYLSKYLENCMNILQNSKTKSRVAIFTPTSHIWSTNLMAELHMSLKIEKHITKEVGDNIQKTGFWYFFVNDYSINNFENLNIYNNDFEVLIVPKTDYIKIETLKNILQISKNKKVIFTNNYPKNVAGLNEFENCQSEFNEIINKLQLSENVEVVKHEEVHTYLSENFEKDLNLTNKEIAYIKKVDKNNKNIIFLSNISDVAKYTELDINFNFKIYDPVTDKFINNIVFENNKLKINFEKNMSLFIIESDEKYSYKNDIDVLEELQLKNCTLLIGSQVFSLNEAKSWESIKQFEYYSGDATYVYDFDTNYKNGILTIENLYSSAEIYLNDEFVNTVWYNNKIVLKNLKNGKNNLKIKVTSTLFNASLNYNTTTNPNKLSENWPHFGQIVNNHRIDKKDTWREKSENLGLQKSGIDGNVTIKLY